MMRRYKVAITVALVGIVGFALAPNSPLGARVWPEPAHSVEPIGAQLPLLMGLGVLEALTMGLGAAFLLFAWPYTKRLFGGYPRLAMFAHVSVAWVLANWWVHDNLHMVLDMDNLWYLLALEYGFHVTLMIAGAILAWSFYKAAGDAELAVIASREPSDTAPVAD